MESKRNYRLNGRTQALLFIRRRKKKKTLIIEECMNAAIGRIAMIRERIDTAFIRMRSIIEAVPQFYLLL